MISHNTLHLGVNVDHIATLRQARATTYPDPVMAADEVRKAGGDSVTVHLREDRRHIQDADVFNIRKLVSLPLNLEMAATVPMLKIATEVKPDECCLVPEKRQELTTEGGLDVVQQYDSLKDYVAQLHEQKISVSAFVDSIHEQLHACHESGFDCVELHTGAYADAQNKSEQMQHLKMLKQGAEYASKLGMKVHAGHGLHYQNVQSIAQILPISCLNIGHSIIARACITGLHEAVMTLKRILIHARLETEQDEA